MPRPRPAAVAVPAEADWIRPAEAAALARVSESTIARWARRRWIGRSKVGGVAYVSRSDIAAPIAAHATPRKVVRVVETLTAVFDRAWESTDFWKEVRR